MTYPTHAMKVVQPEGKITGLGERVHDQESVIEETKDIGN